MHELYAITGQTASGKTAFALRLAAEHNGELVNFDSRQSYRRLDIVTGKDITDHTFHEIRRNGSHSIGYYTILAEEEEIPIWLYDVVDPKTTFSSHDCVELAQMVIADILTRGKTPILVGGTYYYLKHLLYGVGSAPVAPDESLRNELAGLSVETLQTRLRVLNRTLYDALNDSDRNNPRRLIRKIERSIHGGADLTANAYSFTIGDNLGQPLSIRMVGLRHERREYLAERITKRVKDRIDAGAVEEAAALMRDGYRLADPGMKTIGYPQLYMYLEKKLTLEQVVEQWIVKEMQYAKRQLTFMTSDPHIEWRNIA